MKLPRLLLTAALCLTIQACSPSGALTPDAQQYLKDVRSNQDARDRTFPVAGARAVISTFEKQCGEYRGDAAGIARSLASAGYFLFYNRQATSAFYVSRASAPTVLVNSGTKSGKPVAACSVVTQWDDQTYDALLDYAAKRTGSPGRPYDGASAVSNLRRAISFPLKSGDGQLQILVGEVQSGKLGSVTAIAIGQ